MHPGRSQDGGDTLRHLSEALCSGRISRREFITGAAALQGKFWEMHDLLFEQQTLLKPESIPLWAKRIGLNLEQFGSDIKQGVVEKRIKEDRKSGIRSGVNGTPCFFINAARYDGAPDYDSLRAALEGRRAHGVERGDRL